MPGGRHTHKCDYEVVDANRQWNKIRSKLSFMGDPSKSQ